MAVMPILAIVIFFLVTGCTRPRDDTGSDVPEQEFRFSSLGKTDMNMMLEVSIRESRSYLQELMEKLYRRNPRELVKSPYPLAGDNIQRIFSRTSNWKFRELGDIQGTSAIELALSDDYDGDRVFAFIAGLTEMIMAVYNYDTEFYMFDDIDPQALYNCARNIEIAAWRLGSSRDAAGEVFIYSNSLPGEETNYSYANLFGKLTSIQDTMALVVANRTERTISKVIQRMATAVFLPIP